MTSSRLHRIVVRVGASRGFTLIEVLVVVAIIALLVSILMPALGAAKRQARVVVCGTSLKTIGLGTQFYAQASKDDLPAGYKTNASGGAVVDFTTKLTMIDTNPWEFVYPFVQKVNMKQGSIGGDPTTVGMVIQVPVFSCPEDIKQHTTGERIINKQKVKLGLSYGANILPLFRDSVSAALYTANTEELNSLCLTKGAGKLSTMKNPSQIASYYDNGDDGNAISEFAEDPSTGLPRAGWVLADCAAVFQKNQCTFEARHKTGSNFAFMDGHVTFQTINYTGPYYGLPHFPTSWLPGYNRATWSTDPRLAWIRNWEVGIPVKKSFRPPSADRPTWPPG